MNEYANDAADPSIIVMQALNPKVLSESTLDNVLNKVSDEEHDGYEDDEDQFYSDTTPVA